MEMMPGGIGSLLSQNMAPGQDSNAKLKTFMVMMDSMSTKEMDGKTPFTEKSVFRIAAGSGVHPQQVEELLQTHKQFEKMITGEGEVSAACVRLHPP